MKNRAVLVFASLFTVLLFTLLVTFNHQKPRVLIIHSFPESVPWVAEVNTGIERALARNREPLALRWRYMSFSGDMSIAQWAASGRRSRAAIELWEPDVVLVVGEDAQDHVGRYYTVADSPRLVYAMTEDPEIFGYPSAGHITGVHETLPLSQIVELLHHVGGPPLRIRAVGIDDPTGRAEGQQVAGFDWSPHRFVGLDLVSDLGGWQDAVRAAGDDTDVLVVLSFEGLRRAPGAPEAVDRAFIANWTETESRPLAVGVRESFVAGGGAMAVIPSPTGLGEIAARKTLEVLSSIRRGTPLPQPEDSLEFQIALRPERLARRGIALPALYAQAARASQSLYTSTVIDETMTGRPAARSGTTGMP